VPSGKFADVAVQNEFGDRVDGFADEEQWMGVMGPE
jgi:hypothetical protein